MMIIPNHVLKMYNFLVEILPQSVPEGMEYEMSIEHQLRHNSYYRIWVRHYYPITRSFYFTLMTNELKFSVRYDGGELILLPNEPFRQWSSISEVLDFKGGVNQNIGKLLEYIYRPDALLEIAPEVTRHLAVSCVGVKRNK